MMRQRNPMVSLLIFLVAACGLLTGSIQSKLASAATSSADGGALILPNVSSINEVVWAPQSTRLAVSGWQMSGASAIYVLDWANPQRKPFLLDHGSKATFSPDGKTLFVLDHGTAQETLVRAWDVQTRGQQFEIRIPKFWATELVVSQTGHILALASDTRAGATGGQIQLFDIRTRKPVFTQTTEGSRTHVALDRSGSVVVIETESSCSRGAAAVDVIRWQKNEHLLSQPDGSETSFAALSFSPTADRLAIGFGFGPRCLAQGGEVWLVNTQTGQRVGILPRFRGTPAVKFSPDGAFLLTQERDNGQDGTRVWNVRTQAEVKRIQNDVRWLYSNLSPDWTQQVLIEQNRLTLKPFVFNFKRGLAALPTKPPLLTVENFAAYTEQSLQTTYQVNNAGGATSAALHIVKTEQGAQLSLTYQIPSGEQNQNYILIERCFTPAQQWQGAHFLETWVENVNTEPIALVLQFGEGTRCGQAQFAGEVWKAVTMLRPGEKRWLTQVLTESVFRLAGFGPKQNQRLDLDQIGYISIGVESAKPASGSLRVGAIRLWP